MEQQNYGQCAKWKLSARGSVSTEANRQMLRKRAPVPGKDDQNQGITYCRDGAVSRENEWVEEMKEYEPARKQALKLCSRRALKTEQPERLG